MEISLINDLGKLRQLEAEWEELMDNSPDSSFFQTPQWILTWSKHFLGGRSLFVLAAREEGRLHGLAPMFLSEEKNGMPGKTLRFLGDELSDYNDFILRKGMERTILDGFFAYLDEHKDSWKLLQLREFTRESLTLAYLQKMKGSIMEQEEETFRFNIPKDEESVPPVIMAMEAKITERRGRLRIFMKSKPFQAYLAKDYVEFLRLMEVLKGFHIKRWEDTSTPSYFNDPMHEAFFDELHLELWKKGMIEMSVVKRHDDIISTILCYVHGDRCYYYTQAYCWCARNISPSHANFLSAIRTGVQHGLHSFDFGRGEERFKRDYANTSSRNYTVSISNNMMMVPYLRIKNGIIDRLRDSPTLYNRAKRVKEMISVARKNFVS